MIHTNMIVLSTGLRFLTRDEHANDFMEQFLQQ
jgi:hypothetical protein